MKKIKILCHLFILITLSACHDLSDINENPNNVGQTHPQLLLTNIASKAFTVQGTSALYASRMLVQTDGESNNQYYNWNRASFGDYNMLGEVTKMMQEAERINSTEYIALAKFFRAYYFYNLSLTFGDIPYSEALQGETAENYAPTYDSQKEVFIGILKELAEANELLRDNTNLIAGDIIFGGNTLKWQKLVNSFRLKVLMTLSKKEGDAQLGIKESFASIYANEPIMVSNEDNGQLVYADEEGSRYAEFNSSSYGSGMYMSATFVERLKDRQDPRLFIFCGRTKNAKEAGLAIDDFNAYEGGDPLAPYAEVNDKAAAGDVSKVNLRYSTDPTTEPHNLMGYWELEFILAEAAVRGWIATPAKTHYENGVKASFSFYNDYAKNFETYVDASNAATYLSGSLVSFEEAFPTAKKLELILTQKYFTSFLQSGWRMYFDHLRTGYPSFAQTPGITPPTRWMYPQSEYNNNTANVSKAIEVQFGAGNDKIREISWWLQ
ncbi:SusD/RagB family nutrient-binding outer membrane lipoprotein [Arenibacter sp. 6A1]|uniref:SusD/RagB family nutrient-binding outer membrane lipoprotein n=1 Tax=Arenibacter sp. 6A1 TaxID=2720391 RepID=UPI001444C36E|nr:SusD/RagB family nutrient-binding outer membrane lipoprotein [Arenibacter sp. 6A1]NKI26601.1 SusD/RagB family nutrient-binding outer membrane lipoprotein [Arenibacter sp. 6A1]